MEQGIKYRKIKDLEDLTIIDLDTSVLRNKQYSNILENIDTQVKDLFVNLEEVKFVNMTGIGALISLNKAIRSNGDIISFYEPQINVKSLFLTARVNTIFDIYNTFEDAMASYLEKKRSKHEI